jgi:hypothetical protein
MHFERKSPQEPEEPQEKTKQSARKFVIFLLVVGIVAALAIPYLSRNGVSFAKNGNGDCVPPQNSIYEFVGPGNYTHNPSGIVIQVVRAVKNSSFSVQGERNLSLPACSSTDNDLLSVYNLDVTDSDGKSLVLPSAVIVSNQELMSYLIGVNVQQQQEEVAPEAETPLP